MKYGFFKMQIFQLKSGCSDKKFDVFDNRKSAGFLADIIQGRGVEKSPLFCIKKADSKTVTADSNWKQDLLIR